MTAHPLIALYSPIAQSGKSTSARIFAEALKGVTMSFAEPMKVALCNVISPFFEGGEAEYWAWMNDERKDKARIPQLGITLREAMIKFGTGWGRQMIHPELWVMLAQQRQRQLRQSYYTIIDDLRQPNEYVMCRHANALLIKVVREAGERTGSPHEGMLEGYPFSETIENNGTLDDLRAKVYGIVDDYFGPNRTKAD